jgi:glycosyltransferase involved in cell wall biosynthesis
MTSVAYPSEAFPGLEERPRAPGLENGTATVFVVPAYNEEENLLRLLTDFERRPELFPAGSRFIVVDDGSEDRTAAIAESYEGPLPLELVRLGRNQGPGAAFRAGFEAALTSREDDANVVTLEADTTSDLDAVPDMLSRARAGAEVVLADWQMVNVPRLRRVLSNGAAAVVRRALGVQAGTVSSFLRVYRSSTLRRAHGVYGDELIREPGFACKAELLAKLDRLGVRIEEVPVALDTSRRVGKSKMPVLKTIAAYWRMLARQRLARGTGPA